MWVQRVAAASTSCYSAANGHFCVFRSALLTAATYVWLPLTERKTVLRTIHTDNDRVRFAEHIEDRGRDLTVLPVNGIVKAS